jgi:DNA modification methylase
MPDAWFDNGVVQLHQADARSLPIPDNSVDCVVTSPPYWGLRDYGLGEWVGGDADCNHTISMPTKWNDPKRGTNYTRPEVAHRGGDASKCFLCEAQRIDNSIGLEPTPEEYCANMVEVFREVWRVLKPTGTLWLNLGDSYNGSGGEHKHDAGQSGLTNNRKAVGFVPGRNITHLKPKDLVGIPWRVAFALQADGWYLRSDIIWSKPNPMPESVTDRPTKAHEYVFLLTKSPRYYYDADAIREDAAWSRWGAQTIGKQYRGINPIDMDTLEDRRAQGRNKRSVWEITTHPYPEAHFATYPEKLVEPCILAGTSEKGVCARCGKPWVRESIVTNVPERETRDNRISVIPGRDHASRMNSKAMVKVDREFTGWQPTCGCNAETVSATVLDPFAGSGTTLAVAQRLGRRAIGTDLSAEYLELASKRLGRVSLPLF